MNQESKKTFSRIGFALVVMGLITDVLQIIIGLLIVNAGLEDNMALTWFGSLLPLYLVGVPTAYLIMKKLPTVKAISNEEFKVSTVVKALLVSIFIMYVGNIIGTVLSLLLSKGQSENIVANLAMDQSLLKVLFMVILAPIIEEFVFRKLIIDRTVRYGEKVAICFSAICFGLYHMNLYQFFYATGLGIIFGYIYVRSRKIRYSIIMHMIINFNGGVLAPWIISGIDLDKLSDQTFMSNPENIMAILPSLIPYFIYAMVLFMLVIVGIVILVLNFKKIQFNHQIDELEKKQVFKTTYVNPGVIVFIIFCVASMIWALFA